MQAVGFVVFVWAEGWRATLLVVPLLQPDSGATAVLVDKLDPSPIRMPVGSPGVLPRRAEPQFFRPLPHAWLRTARETQRDPRLHTKIAGAHSQNVS